jgi:membrane protein insertase Oxa1/YidC/SpoIIIJ
MDFFTLYIYQPFFNILVGLYWVTSQILQEPDMGIAVIFFAVAVRLILLPIDLVSERSDEDKFKISEKIKQFKKEYSDNPMRLKEETKKIMRQSPGAIFSEIFSVVIQLTIIVVLYRIFTTGLEGADMHLLYSFMPYIKEPINLMFLGVYDLSRTNSALNIIQSLMIALSEYIHLSLSPIKSSRKEFYSLVVIFPVVCFLVFIFLPAGKKVFIISSLAFTVLIRLYKHASYLYFTSRQVDAADIPTEEKKV